MWAYGLPVLKDNLNINFPCKVLCNLALISFNITIAQQFTELRLLKPTYVAIKINTKGSSHD